MIDGIKFKVGYVEINNHCRARADYHRDRAADKEKELPGLREALTRITGAKDLADSPTVQKSMNWLNETIGGAMVSYKLEAKEIVSRLEADIRNHRDKAKRFEFFANHTFDLTYCLDTADLEKLEFFSTER